MKSKKVLIVDDNELNRKLFEHIIGQLYDFESARDGIEAVQLATKSSFDLILMDIQMPKMNGIQAMQRIREHPFGGCPILALTAYADEVDRQSFLNQGFDEFITKPIQPREFIVKIQSLIDKTFPPESHLQPPSHAPNLLNKSTLQQLLKYNSKEFITKIYLDFWAECQETLEKITASPKDLISTELMEKLHTLKGNSGTLGAEKIYYAAIGCEAAGRQKKISEFVDTLELLKKELENFKEFLDQETIFEI